jgi:hypothetical protein
MEVVLGEESASNDGNAHLLGHSDIPSATDEEACGTGSRRSLQTRDQIIPRPIPSSPRDDDAAGYVACPLSVSAAPAGDFD